MGITYVQLEIANVASRDQLVTVECMVDSGAIYTVIQRSVLEALKVEPIAEETFFLANGDKLVRQRGGISVKYEEKQGYADVIFGEEGDSNLLGATTLESLGLALDPLRRELKPMQLIIGGWRPGN